MRVRRQRSRAICAFFVFLASCGTQENDPHSNRGLPPPEGFDARIREIADPKSELKAEHLDSVAVSGTVVVAIDTFDEVGNGSGRGLVYVQDLGSTEPYSGMALFAPSIIPASFKIGPGDVLDLRGQYQEATERGAAVFPEGSFSVQIARPTATFRYEVQVPPPVDVPLEDLADFETGRRWLGMLVRVKNVTVHEDVNRDALFNGRLSTPLMPPDPDRRGCDAPFPKPPTLVNALSDVPELDAPAGTTFKSVTGIVLFFCNLQIAPRTLADVER